MTGSVLVAWWLLGACADAPGPASAPSAPAPTAQRPHVVLFTLDTTRADRLGAYGYDEARTETLDALAASGRRFEHAFSPLPLTIPSHATMFTGLYPPTHGIRSNGSGTLTEDRVTLAERLKEAGYTTGASVAAFVTTRQWGFAQGFDAYFDDIPADAKNFWHGERPADQVVDDALAWVETVPDGQPMFLWVHLYDAHFPYRPPEGYDADAGFKPYDGEVAFVDDQVARVVEAFAGEPTLFAVVADHGEGLGDHGELAHGLYAYNATQHVPFLLSGPGVPAEVVSEPVSLADLMPTILATLGLPVPDDVEGRPRPSGGAGAPVYMETWQLAQRFAIAPHLALVDGRWKLVDTPRPELYDLTTDMGEARDLAAANPGVVAQLVEKLDAFGFPPPGQDEGRLDPALQAELAALGYVDGEQAFDLTAELPDPKDHADLVVTIQRIERLVSQRKDDEALAELRAMIARYPHVVEFRTRLISILAKDRARLPEVLAEVDAGLEAIPDSIQLLGFKASHLAVAGRFSEAADLYLRVAAAQQYTPRTKALAVAALRRAGRRLEALDHGHRWMFEHPDDAHLAGVLGILAIETGDYEGAVTLLQQGVTADVPELEVAWYLSAHEIRRGDLERGAELLQLELEHHPEHIRAAAVLARVAVPLQRWDVQLDAARKVLAVNPRDAEIRHLAALALFNQERYDEARTEVKAGLDVDPASPDLLLLDANLLLKAGLEDAGRARFEEAKAARAARAAAPTNPADIAGVPDLERQGEADPSTLPAWDAVPPAVGR